MDFVKGIVAIMGGIIGLLAFIKGVTEFVHSNAIRRYEEFHQMSVLFDENEDIQKVCAWLNGSNDSEGTLTRQQKEVFICFLEEIYFMIKSGIMKQGLALYTFSYYGKMVFDSKQFWHGLNKNEAFYVHFVEFCRLANSYQPSSSMFKKQLSY